MCLMLEPPESKGIYVGINSWSGRTPDDYCLAGPIVVSVRNNGASAQFFLNGSEIKREELAGALRTQLATRTNWEVFVEGDDSVPYSDAMDAIEQITALHAMSVMLTPKLKRELSEQCPSR